MAELGFCVPCLKKGHRCETRNLVDGEFVCVFCEDGAECPIAAEGRRKARTCKQPGCVRVVIDSNETGLCCYHMPKPNKGNDNFSKLNARVAAQKKPPTTTKGNTPMEKRKCAKPECTKLIGAACKSGYCGSHFYLSKQKPGATPRTNADAKPVVKRATSNVKPKASTPPQQSAGHVAITVREEYLDKWFAKLPPDQKAAQFSAWLDRNRDA